MTPNRVLSSGREGISVFRPVSEAVVSGNVVHGNGRHGINVHNGSVGNLLGSNTAARNARIGILVAGQANRIVANAARLNGGGDLRDANPGDACDDNAWSRNRFGTASPACAGG